MSRRRLSDEEKELWQRVAQTTRRMVPPKRDAKDSTHPPQDTASHDTASRRANPPAPPLAIPPLATPAPPRLPAKPGTRFDPAPSVSERLSREPVRMDRALHKTMMRGKLEPDARIDLHGMTVAQAHHALLGFVMGAHARGHRLLLVITGKGRSKPRDDHAPMPARAGILKHEVPIWLRQAPLGPLVLDLREAHRRQGGSGAYYVYLRKRGR